MRGRTGRGAKTATSSSWFVSFVVLFIYLFLEKNKQILFIDESRPKWIDSIWKQPKEVPWKISAPSNIHLFSEMNLRPWAGNLNQRFDSAKTAKPMQAQWTKVNLHPVGLTWETSILPLWFPLTVNMCSLMGSLRGCLQEGYTSFPICFHRKIWQTVEFVSGWSCAHNA